MMIPVLTDYYEPGYLARPEYETLAAFFPNGNLSIRKEVFAEIGLYDEAFNKAGEDADICRRSATAGWDLYYEQGAVCYHEARRSILDLVRQWWAYGYHGGHFFQKAQKHRCEIFISLEARPRVYRYFRLFKTGRTPFRILLFLTYFSLSHLLFFLALMSFWAGFHWIALFLSAGIVVSAILLYLRSPLKKLSLRQLLIYETMSYIINFSHLLGGLVGGLKQRMLYIGPGL